MQGFGIAKSTRITIHINSIQEQILKSESLNVDTFNVTFYIFNNWVKKYDRAGSSFAEMRKAGSLYNYAAFLFSFYCHAFITDMYVH